MHTTIFLMLPSGHVSNTSNSWPFPHTQTCFSPVFTMSENNATIHPVTQTRHQGITLDMLFPSSPHHSSSTFSPNYISNTSTLFSSASSLVLLQLPLALPRGTAATSYLPGCLSWLSFFPTSSQTAAPVLVLKCRYVHVTHMHTCACTHTQISFFINIQLTSFYSY